MLTHWKEREPAYRRRRERIEEQMGRVPAFPEENVVARTEGGPEEPVQAETPVAAASGDAEPVGTAEPVGGPPGRSQVPGVIPEPPGPVPPPPAPEPPSRRRPWALRVTAGPTARTVSSAGGDGIGENGGDGAESQQSERPELSEASAAALRRVREQQSGGRRGKRRKKHGRNR